MIKLFCKALEKRQSGVSRCDRFFRLVGRIQPCQSNKIFNFSGNGASQAVIVERSVDNFQRQNKNENLSDLTKR